MEPINAVELQHLKQFLNSPYEVNQELGIASLKGLGIPEENWQEWHQLMSSSIQKLRFCMLHQLQEQLRIIRLSDFSMTERAYLSIVESFPNLEQLHLNNQAYLDYEWIINWQKLPKLQTLSLMHNKLKVIPRGITNAIQLERLYLGNNRILKIDAGICELSALKQLSIRKNRLRKIPTQMTGLKKLKYLDLAHNYLPKIGQELYLLSNLETLNVSFNQLSTLPKGIGRLKKLKVLNISGNRMDELPDDLLELKSLMSIHLKATPLARNTEAIAELKRQLKGVKIYC